MAELSEDRGALDPVQTTRWFIRGPSQSLTWACSHASSREWPDPAAARGGHCPEPRIVIIPHWHLSTNLENCVGCSYSCEGL